MLLLWDAQTFLSQSKSHSHLGNAFLFGRIERNWDGKKDGEGEEEEERWLQHNFIIHKVYSPQVGSRDPNPDPGAWQYVLSSRHVTASPLLSTCYSVHFGLSYIWKSSFTCEISATIFTLVLLCHLEVWLTRCLSALMWDSPCHSKHIWDGKTTHACSTFTCHV